MSLTLTSLLSDSAIFLLRSMQRDECLIPIRACKNVLTLGRSREKMWYRECAPFDSQASQLFAIRFNSHSHHQLQCSLEILWKYTTLHEVPKGLHPPLPSSVVDSIMQKFAVHRFLESVSWLGIVWHQLSWNWYKRRVLSHDPASERGQRSQKTAALAAADCHERSVCSRVWLIPLPQRCF